MHTVSKCQSKQKMQRSLIRLLTTAHRKGQYSALKYSVAGVSVSVEVLMESYEHRCMFFLLLPCFLSDCSSK